MQIVQGDSEFEVLILRTDEEEWEGRITEYNIIRLTPITHLRHSWTTLDAAVAGVTRRWQRLFPDDPAPDFHDAIVD